MPKVGTGPPSISPEALTRALKAAAARVVVTPAMCRSLARSPKDAQAVIDGILEEVSFRILVSLGIRKDETPALRIAQALRTACTVMGSNSKVTPDDILGPSRATRIVIARAIAAYLLHQHLGMSKSAIARMMGRTHATVIHYIRSLKDTASVDKRTAAILQEAVQTLEC